MTEQPGHRVATPALLGSCVAYYRSRADECERLLAGIREQPPVVLGDAATVERERDLWIQLADELDAYLDVDDGPGLF